MQKSTICHGLIAVRAHELHEERPWATPQDNWLLAERQLRGEFAPKAQAIPAAEPAPAVEAHPKKHAPKRRRKVEA